jgi:hypothetical protein
MPARPVDIGPALRAALIAAPEITGLLDQWKGEPAIHTRRPVPADSPARFILVNPDAAIGNADGLKSRRPVVQRDICAYGNQPKDYREVEEIGYAMQLLFHHQPQIIDMDGYHCIDIVVSVPTPAPTDDKTQVARMVNLTIWLQRID